MKHAARFHGRHDSRCTTRVSEAEATGPTSLLASQRYTPVAWRLATWNCRRAWRRSSRSSSSVIAESSAPPCRFKSLIGAQDISLEKNGMSFLTMAVQAITGAGTPLAAQKRFTLSPSCTVTTDSSGSSDTEAGTATPNTSNYIQL